MTAVLEREMTSEILYQPDLPHAGTDDRTRCSVAHCDKLAVWYFHYHTDDEKPCSKYFYCGAHTDYAIENLLKRFAVGDVKCTLCGTIYSTMNDYVKVVRIP